MSYGYPDKAVFTGTLASGASTVTSIDLGSNGWHTTLLALSSLSTNAELAVYVSDDNSTFRRLFEQVNTATFQHQQVLIASSTHDCVIPLGLNARYVQLRASAVVSGGGSYKVICS